MYASNTMEPRASSSRASGPALASGDGPSSSPASAEGEAPLEDALHPVVVVRRPRPADGGGGLGLTAGGLLLVNGGGGPAVSRQLSTTSVGSVG